MINQAHEYIVILVTAKDSEEASKISQNLLDKRLVACGNIINPVNSLFWWEGKLDKAEEAMLILKTHYSLFDEVVRVVKSIHSYSVPEILALPILDGNKDYLRWIDESIDKRREVK